jgi:Domain of Unknown Function (DUF1259)
MIFSMRILALAAFLAGMSGLALAADNGWQAEVGKALGKTGDQGMVMGDLVLTKEEVNPVMAKLAAAHRDHRAAQSFAAQPAAPLFHALLGQ